LASNGGDNFDNAETIVGSKIQEDSPEYEDELASYKLENSYIGKIGKGIEPVIEPLGYDWKIGIAIVTSFAAREVFVSTLATIYNVGSGDSEVATIKERMSQEVHADTGKKVFDLATGMSLMIFYAFAMQCIGTLAVVKKETKSWYWPVAQFVMMSILAYFSAWITYLIFI
jgi:ferrous iron transport protein B